MAGDKIRGLTFGEVAEEYDRVRPGYPAELFKDLLGYSAPGRALEIGAGTGKATMAVASTGVQVVALEPDPAMALVLRQRAAGLAVNIAMGTLESYEPEEQFDLVYSAQAFHWTKQETRWPRTAALLRPGGSLALFWNHDRLADAGARAKVAEILQGHELAPADDLPTLDDAQRIWPATELAGRAEFGEQRQERYVSERELPREDYLAYLTTQSAYRILDDEERDELLDELRSVLPGTVTLDVVTLLYLARKSRPGV
ncbi:class I SAM-dependent methyltransferase [Kribbella sp. CA-293567]|uniref:class I SAM-dependent methyltransferase n=1 Tax=Kribbella sp. CA-293567 TaxID=3002436 RepID=UPI0022DD0C9F|nr:class I SAM-dependent methyltransferase [Kribbella sp. CA-293567]WBQ07668.1 class I SAM-dependent methyltransferase [Kribbella sp. CA-293567]